MRAFGTPLAFILAKTILGAVLFVAILFAVLPVDVFGIAHGQPDVPKPNPANINFDKLEGMKEVQKHCPCVVTASGTLPPDVEVVIELNTFDDDEDYDDENVHADNDDDDDNEGDTRNKPMVLKCNNKKIEFGDSENVFRGAIINNREKKIRCATVKVVDKTGLDFLLFKNELSIFEEIYLEGLKAGGYEDDDKTDDLFGRVIKLYAYKIADDRAVLVQELVLESLEDRMNRVNEKDGRFIMQTLRDMLLAIKQFHKVGTHLDLKPNNFVYVKNNKQKSVAKWWHFGNNKNSDDRQLKLANFGRSQGSKGFHPKIEKSLCERPFDTLKYVSPEIILACEDQNSKFSQHFSIKSDIWSIGVILYRLVFDMMPFVSNNGQNLGIKKLIKEEQKKTLLLNTGFLRAVENLVHTPDTHKAINAEFKKNLAAHIDVIDACLQNDQKIRPCPGGILDYLDDNCMFPDGIVYGNYSRRFKLPNKGQNKWFNDQVAIRHNRERVNRTYCSTSALSDRSTYQGFWSNADSDEDDHEYGYDDENKETRPFSGQNGGEEKPKEDHSEKVHHAYSVSPNQPGDYNKQEISDSDKDILTEHYIDDKNGQTATGNEPLTPVDEEEEHHKHHEGSVIHDALTEDKNESHHLDNGANKQGDNHESEYNNQHGQDNKTDDETLGDENSAGEQGDSHHILDGVNENNRYDDSSK